MARSSETTGAASAAPLATVTRDGATPALADQWEAEAIDAIAGVQDPEQADWLLGQVTLAAQAMRIAKLGEDRERRWHGLRVKAEARYGELLGPATDKGGGKRTVSTTNSDRQRQHQARKVAAVKAQDPDGFEDYIANDPKPSRKGLLNRKPKRDEPKQMGYNNRHWENDEVIAWVARRMRAGRSRDQIFEESKAGEYDWPLGSRFWLPKNTVDIIRAIVDDRKRRGDTIRRRQSSESGRRSRQLHAEKRAGRTDGLWDLQVAIAQAVGGLEMFRLPELSWSESTEALIMDLYDDLARHARWSEAALELVTAHMSELGRQRKVQTLEARASDPSSTDAERATAARLAEVLKRKRKRLPSAS